MTNDKCDEVFCVHLDEWQPGGATPDEQLTSIDLRFNQGFNMKNVVAIIKEQRGEA